MLEPTVPRYYEVDIKFKIGEARSVGSQTAPDLGDKSLSLQVARDDLRRVRVVESNPAEPGPGGVLFQVERFGLSANNVSYALLGDRLGYWQFFPAGAGWGQIPVWGYLRAVVSRSSEVEVGRRAFGLCPMSTHLLMRPGRGDAAGFRDTSAHRSAVSSVYNVYFWADGGDAGSRIDDALVVLRPLFWLSFTLDDYLAERDGAASGVVVTSASSKAAIGLAHLLRQRGVPAIGLTSPQHTRFAEGLSLYEAVVAYDQLDALTTLAGTRPAVVDIAGNPSLRQMIGRRLAGRLASVVVAGSTHWGGSPASGGLPGEQSEFFFAPQRIRQLSRTWGWPTLEQRFAAALRQFAETATWINVETAHGIDGALHVYRQVLDNTAPPAVAHLIDLAA